MSVRQCTSTVAKFYDGKSVFVTGATGFVGKVLIEKLLYSCTNIEKVYVLMRKTAQQNLDQRLAGLLQSTAFTRIRKEKPQALTKIIPVAGDLALPNLGIERHDEETILQNVAVVFNMAASINFTAPLQHNFKLNVEGTEKMLDLSRRIRGLEGFVHFSTAFCNYNLQVSEEVVYPPPARWEDVYKFLENNRNGKELKKLLNGHPNTYTFTKALAETLVVEKRGTIPTAIVRPSIVMPALAEPMAGWIDNWQGSIALLTASANGRLSGILGADHNISDLVPVDYVANMAIIVATKCTNEVAVYQCCTSSVNPLTSRDSVDYYGTEAVNKGFLNKFIPLSNVIFFKHAITMEIFVFMMQTVPAYCMDLLRITRREKPRYVKSLALLATLRKATQPFTGRSWQFRSERAQELIRSLPPADRRLFPCDTTHIHWRPYLAACFRGVQKHLVRKQK
ncbi:putative fatty acyl-CoA reductase CG5065 [Choristoneura fumiferana]|uniref:putative fatty acyl-CoA reductase CG5065 n=1 Tax=Choristoneura fumiferana TaxID=7141 RepID=UPI003D15A41C